MSDDEIRKENLQVEAAKEDPKEFGPLYEKYYKGIFVFIFRRTGDEELTADICSQVFLKAMTNIHKYEFRGLPFSSWLFRIANNELNQYFRDNKINERTVSLEKEQVGDMLSDMNEIRNDEKHTFLIEALNSLKNEEIQIIELRFFEKRPFKEVGDILGITENNAKVKVYRILDKLKKALSIKIQTT